MKKTIFPVSSICIQTDLSPSEVEARLQAHVTAHPALTPWYRVHEYSGWVQDSRFSLKPILHYRKVPRVQIDGKILGETGKAQVQLNLCIRKVDRIILMCAETVALLLAILLLCLGDVLILTGLICLGQGLLVYTMLSVGFRIEAKKEIEKIREILK